MNKSLSIFILVCFFITGQIGTCPVYAQEFSLPTPGARVSLSPEFNPPSLKGIKVHTENPFRFDFILDKGDSNLADKALKEEATKLIKYFLASLTVPEEDLWVNLSPYEKDRIVPNAFGRTEMGRDLLAEDYLLKQITASLIYPEDEIGKKFWKRVYEEAAKKFGTTDIPVNTFNKVWIVPEKAVVYENAKVGTAYVVESRLKVMLEQDYLALEKNDATDKRESKKQLQDTSSLGSQIVREIVIPELTKEVNEGKNFSKLRQVYQSLILAAWYKKKIKDSILNQIYIDQKKIEGINIDDPNQKQKIYEQYLQAFKKGVYNYIKEEYDPATQVLMPRKYFSGGLFLKVNTIFRDLAQLSHDYPKLLNDFDNSSLVQVRLDQAMLAPDEEQRVSFHDVNKSEDRAMKAISFPISRNAIGTFPENIQRVISFVIDSHERNESGFEREIQLIDQDVRLTILELKKHGISLEEFIKTIFKVIKSDSLYLDGLYIERTLELAENQAKEGQVPIVAIAVNKKTGDVIIGQRPFWEDSDSKIILNEHTEINALQKAVAQGWRMENTDVYVSVESCTNCALSIASNFRPRRVIAAVIDSYPGIRGRGKEIIETQGVDSVLIPLHSIQQRAQGIIDQFYDLLPKSLRHHNGDFKLPSTTWGISQLLDAPEQIQIEIERILSGKKFTNSSPKELTTLVYYFIKTNNLLLGEEFPQIVAIDANHMSVDAPKNEYFKNPLREIVTMRNRVNPKNDRFKVILLGNRDNVQLRFEEIMRSRLIEPWRIYIIENGKVVPYIDARPFEKGALSQEHVLYDMAVKRVFNPNNSFKKVVYGGAGVDVTNFLLSLNAKRGLFVSKNYDGLTTEDLKKVEEHYNDTSSSYAAFKFRNGHAKTEMVEKKEDIIRNLAHELRGLDVKELKFDSFGEHPGIRFKWSYVGEKEEEYEIIFIEGDITKPETYPLFLREQIEKGIDGYYQRAGFQIPKAYQNGFIDYLFRNMNEGAKFVTDDYYYGYYDPDIESQVFFDGSKNFPKLNVKAIAVSVAQNVEQKLFGTAYRMARDYYGWHMRIREKVSERDKAQTSTVEDPGGIDFTANKTPLEIQNAGEGIKFHLDPAMFQQLQNAPGFVPVILSIQPMPDMKIFLGIKEAAILSPAGAN